eukprot:363478-Prymnesium_polylepis.1
MDVDMHMHMHTMCTRYAHAHHVYAHAHAHVRARVRLHACPRPAARSYREEAQPGGVTLELKPYQRQALGWMLDMEALPRGINGLFWEQRPFADVRHATPRALAHAVPYRLLAPFAVAWLVARAAPASPSARAGRELLLLSAAGRDAARAAAHDARRAALRRDGPRQDGRAHGPHRRLAPRAAAHPAERRAAVARHAHRRAAESRLA